MFSGSVPHLMGGIKLAEFKVGDKVEILAKGTSINNVGDIGFIKEISGGAARVCVEGNDEKVDWSSFDNIKLVEQKRTKNQRIKALEQTVETQGCIIVELKRDLQQLNKAVEDYFKLPVEPSTDDEATITKLHSQNGETVFEQLEYEGRKYKKVDREAREGDVVILNDVGGSHYFETNKPYKVQKDIYINGVGMHSGHKEAHPVYTEYYNRTPETVDVYELIAIPFDDLPDAQPVQHQTVPCAAAKTPNELRAEIIEKAKEITSNINNSEFIVNEDKRTVVLLIRSTSTKKVIDRKIAKCHPDDVFNVYIGKAIVTCRALNKDASEFEQAVQPTVAIEGVILSDGERKLELTDKTYVFGKTCQSGSWYARNAKIINDTNAIYGGVE